MVQGDSATPMVRHAVDRLLRHRADALQRPAGFRRCARDLVDEDDTARRRGACLSRRGVALATSSLPITVCDLDAVHREHFGGHGESHLVAAVVADDVENAAAAIGRLQRFADRIHQGPANTSPTAQVSRKSLADVTRKQRQMAEAAAGDEADLAVVLRRLAR